jgi:hypothetical protein
VIVRAARGSVKRAGTSNIVLTLNQKEEPNDKTWIK